MWHWKCVIIYPSKWLTLLKGNLEESVPFWMVYFISALWACWGRTGQEKGPVEVVHCQYGMKYNGSRMHEAANWRAYLSYLCFNFVISEAAKTVTMCHYDRRNMDAVSTIPPAVQNGAKLSGIQQLPPCLCSCDQAAETRYAFPSNHKLHTLFGETSKRDGWGIAYPFILCQDTVHMQNHDSETDTKGNWGEKEKIVPVTKQEWRWGG